MFSLAAYFRFVMNSGDAGVGAAIAVGLAWLALVCGAGWFGWGMIAGAAVSFGFALAVNYGWGYVGGLLAAVREVRETLGR